MELIPLAKSKKTDEKEKEELSSEDSFKMDLFFWLQALVAALITLILLFTFVGRIIGVDGDSMYPSTTGICFSSRAWAMSPGRGTWWCSPRSLTPPTAPLSSG